MGIVLYLNNVLCLKTFKRLYYPKKYSYSRLLENISCELFDPCMKCNIARISCDYSFNDQLSVKWSSTLGGIKIRSSVLSLCVRGAGRGL